MIRRFSRKRALIGAAIALPCLLTGLWLIVDYGASIPPDTAADEPADLVAYMLSAHFNHLPPREQRRFTEETMRRYASMTDEQRKMVDERVGRMRENDPDALREQALRIWKSYVVAEAEQYVQLPPERRDAWLNSRVPIWKLMGGDGRGPKDAKSRQQEEQQRSPLSPERQTKIVEYFQTDIFPRSTARERALVMAMAKDAAEKMRK